MPKSFFDIWYASRIDYLTDLLLESRDQEPGEAERILNRCERIRQEIDHDHQQHVVSDEQHSQAIAKLDSVVTMTELSRAA